ncbi:MAG: serine/threonine-protein kinase [Thermoanaerobaculia bacterium]
MSLVGTTVGRIRVLETLGKGGMGDVYVGYDETLKRKVALKAIRDESRLDDEAKARFLREARMLSQLDHPGICRIHEYVEGDETDFLVLELIAGKSLRSALEDELDPAFKLHVAERVADALVAAHAKGIAHRDLKPENVMITEDGGVKVLDFGLAYTADRSLARGEPAADPRPEAEPAFDSGATMQGLRSRRGTAESADAERGDTEPLSATVQMAGEPWSDGTGSGGTRSDGTRPESTSSVDSDLGIRTQQGMVMGTIAYMSPEQARSERAAVEGDVYSLGLLIQELFTGGSPYRAGLPMMQQLALVARAETLPMTGTDPDLAELVTRMKSLDPAARPTAAETVERLRWIRGKPGRRLLRQIAAVLVAILLLGGLKYTFDLRAEQQLADESRREAEEVSEFLVSLFAVADPRHTRGDAVTAVELLDAGADRIAELDGQPMSQARLMLTMGRVYRQLGIYERAAPLLERALAIYRQRLGEKHLETARGLDLLANVYHDQGEYGRAEPLFESSLKIREQQLGRDHPHVAASLNNLAILYQTRNQADRAEPLLLRALQIQQAASGAASAEVAWSLNNLGELYRGRGELERAELFLRRSMEIQEELLGGDHPSLATALNNLAAVYHEQGEAERSEELYRRALAISEKVLGTEHPNVATSLNNLAEHYRTRGDYARAEPLYERALTILEQSLGTAHPSVAVMLSNLADLYCARGEWQRAEPLYRRAAEIQEQALGSEDPSVAVTLDHLADLYLARGDGEGAGSLYRRALEIQESSLGGDHPGTVLTRVDLADLSLRQGRTEEAEALLTHSQAILATALASQPSNRRYQSRLAAVHIGLGKLHRAVGDGERAAESWQRAVDVIAPLTAGSAAVADLHAHALALFYLGRVDEARPLATALLAKGWSHPDFLVAIESPEGATAFSPGREPRDRQPRDRQPRDRR